MFRSKSEIQLAPHQVHAIEKLVKERPKQHGMVLYHYMGSGKTITSLSYAMNFPDKRVVVMCPKGLEHVWETERTKINSSHINVITFDALDNIPWKRLKKQVENCIFIVDEAHNLLPKLHMSKQLSRAFDIFRGTFRVLLLSGTPIWTQITDITTMVNFVKRNDASLLPMTYHQFYKKYGEANKKLLKRTRKDIHNINRSIFNLKHGLERIFEFGIKSLTYSALVPIALVTLAPPRIPDHQVMHASYEVGKVSFIVLLNLFTVVAVGKSMSYRSNVDSIPYREIYSINFPKLCKDISKYVSYYNQFAAAKDKSEYPETQYRVRQYMYSDSQCEDFYSVMFGEPGSDLTNYLDYGNNKTLFQVALEDRVMYETTCRLLSSISPMFLKNKTVRRGNTYEFEKFVDEKQTPMDNPKFLYILGRYRDKPTKTVLYSNFYTTFTRICAWLKHSKVPHHTMESSSNMQSIHAFNKSDHDILVLHPDVYEGISLKGVRTLHIMEPIAVPLIRMQLVARCVRRFSHSHLPTRERTVEVYDHLCYQQQFFNYTEADNGNKRQTNAIRRFNKRMTFDEQVKSLRAIRYEVPNIDQNSSIGHAIDFAVKKHKFKNSKVYEKISRFVDLNLGELSNVIYAHGGLRQRFFKNPDFETFLNTLSLQEIVKGILETLEKDMLTERGTKTIECDCEIWTPTSKGTCRHRRDCIADKKKRSSPEQS